MTRRFKASDPEGAEENDQYANRQQRKDSAAVHHEAF
jgi:hypothetical protein